MKICLKMHARTEVMLNRAFKVGHFPLSRRNILVVEQHRAEMPLQKWWFWSQFRYGNIVAILAKIVRRQLAFHFHNICKKNEENSCQEASKIKFFEPNHGWIANHECKTAPNRKSVPNPHRSNIFSGGKGPSGGGLQGPMHPKVVRNCHFWKHFA